MGKEIRKVPAGWEHPKQEGYSDGRLQPMYDKSFREAVADWKSGFAAWERGERPDYADDDGEYWEWECSPPDRAYYRPDWTDEERTHIQLYETVSEGTPLSPAFATPEELARYLADNGTFWMQKVAREGREQWERNLDYEGWLRFIRAGWAPSMVMSGGVLMEGTEFMASKEPSDA